MWNIGAECGERRGTRKREKGEVVRARRDKGECGLRGPHGVVKSIRPEASSPVCQRYLLAGTARTGIEPRVEIFSRCLEELGGEGQGREDEAENKISSTVCPLRELYSTSASNLRRSSSSTSTSLLLRSLPQLRRILRPATVLAHCLVENDQSRISPSQISESMDR